MVTVHAIYGKRKSRELIRTQGDHFYHIGVFVSYRQNQKAKSNLVQYILMQCEKVLVPYLATFPKTCPLLQPWKILIIKKDHQPLVRIVIMILCRHFFKLSQITHNPNAKFSNSENSFRLDILSSSLAKNNTI